MNSRFRVTACSVAKALTRYASAAAFVAAAGAQDAPQSSAAAASAAAAAATAASAAATSFAVSPTSAAAAASAAVAVSPFTAWAEAFAADWVRQSAERATATQYFNGAEQDALERQLTPQTAARRERQRMLARGGLILLAAFAEAGLSEAESTDAAILRWSLGRSLAAAPFEDHNFIFNQLNGPQIGLVNLLTEIHPLRRAADLQSYQSRLMQVPARLDEAIARARSAATRGLLPPRFILERARTQVEDFLRPAAADNVFVTALARRGAAIAAPGAEARAQAVTLAMAAATETVATQVLPAYERVLALLNELHPRTTDDAGLWRLPDGDKAYAEALASFTTTSLGPDEIHAIGLREVGRIEAEMDRVLQSLGRATGSVEERFKALRAELQPPAGSDPRPALLARYAEIVIDNQARSKALFNMMPAAPVEVHRVPVLTERTASAYYTTPAPDGSRPGIFWVPLPGPAFDLLRMRSLTVHEAVPGHHFQLALQQEQRDLPRWRQRRIFGGGSAHSEGWALYAERLALDHGWYEGDPHSLLGALDGQRFRARRLVVDTGLHAKRWTRQQAIDYGLSAREVERYVANPGQATAYMVGMLHILALRAEVQTAMGERFSLPAFHDVVLQTGSVPLDVLSRVVRRWAAAPQPVAAAGAERVGGSAGAGTSPGTSGPGALPPR